jgi:hypothetical protein
MVPSTAQDCLVFGFSQTGVSNTRLNSQRSAFSLENVLQPPKKLRSPRFDVSIDYMAFRLPIHSVIDVESVLFYLGQMTKDVFVEKPGSSFTPVVGNKFTNYSVSTFGCQIFWNLPQALDSLGDMMIILKGKTLAQCNFMERIDIILRIIDRGGRLTRIDPCVDAYDSPDITFDNLFSAYQSRNYSGCSKRQMNQSGTDKLGTTFYFGSRESAALLRLYDKAAESGKTDIPWWRLELELKQKKAKEVGELIYNSILYDEKQLKQLIVDLVTGQIDFVDRGGLDKDSGRKEDIPRCNRLEWWQNFITAVNSVPLRLSPSSPKKTLEKSLNWHNKSVSTTEAMIYEVYGEREFMKWFRRQLADGRSRFNDFHRAVIKQAKKYDNQLLLS